MPNDNPQIPGLPVFSSIREGAAINRPPLPTQLGPPGTVDFPPSLGLTIILGGVVVRRTLFQYGTPAGLPPPLVGSPAVISVTYAAGTPNTIVMALTNNIDEVKFEGSLLSIFRPAQSGFSATGAIVFTEVADLTANELTYDLPFDLEGEWVYQVLAPQNVFTAGGGVLGSNLTGNVIIP